MRLISYNDTQARRGPRDWFTGDVWLEANELPRPGATVARVTFAPGARTNWHTHVEGQFLFVVSGGGRAGTEDGTVRQLSPGDVVWFEPGERHWHGASASTPMVHIAIAPAIGTGGGTDWMEPVSDEDYGL